MHAIQEYGCIALLESGRAGVLAAILLDDQGTCMQRHWCACLCMHEEREICTLAATLLGVLMRADAPPAVDAGGTPGELGASGNGSSETVAEKLEAQQAAAASAAARASQAYDRRVQVRGRLQSLQCRMMRSAGHTHGQACQELWVLAGMRAAALRGEGWPFLGSAASLCSSRASQRFADCIPCASALRDRHAHP